LTLSRVTTPLRHLNNTPHPTLLQLTTRTFLNTRVEFESCSDLSVILIVTRHWELLIFNDNHFFKPG
jgi:hypothetical protein